MENLASRESLEHHNVRFSNQRSRAAASSNRIVALWRTAIGKKIVMGITGGVLGLFVIGHMYGNLKAFQGATQINAYAAFLRDMGQPELEYGQLLWIVRAVLLACVILHVTAAVQLSRKNWKARPIEYRKKHDMETTFAAKTMPWSGLLLLVFVVFHLLHLTVGAVGFKAGQFKHLAAYQNVVATFTSWPITLFYVVALGALCLHLQHGIASTFQTLGFDNSHNTRTLKLVSCAIALLVFLGFVSVPVSVFAGWLR